EPQRRVRTAARAAVLSALHQPYGIDPHRTERGVFRRWPVPAGRRPVGVRLCYHTPMDSSGDAPTPAALAWLLSSKEPAVRYLTRRALLEDRDGAAAARRAAPPLGGPRARR